MVVSLMKTAKTTTKDSSTLAKFNFVEDDNYEFEVRSSLPDDPGSSNSCRFTFFVNLGGSNYGGSP